MSLFPSPIEEETPMLMSAADYRESLRRFNPVVFVNGRRIESVADDPVLAPGINAVGTTYDFAFEPEYRPLMLATQASSGREVNRMLHINETSVDLLSKLEAVRLLCKHCGCAQRYLTHDALNAIWQATHRIDADKGADYHQRFVTYLHQIQDEDLTLGVAMTDAKGDRSKRPHEQQVPETYVRIVERRPDGIVILGTKAIVTGAPYVHGFLVMPCRNMGREDADFAVCCAVPLDAPGVTIVARPAGRPGENGAVFTGKYGQSTGVVLFDNVFVPHERVFLAGEWEHSGFLTATYATHHRHSCIGARAGFGDLLIGAGVLMYEANGLNASLHGHVRDAMVELIKIVEGFFACGVAASVYGLKDSSGNIQPDSSSATSGNSCSRLRSTTCNASPTTSRAVSLWRCPAPRRTTTRQPKHACRPSSPAARTSRRGAGLRWRVSSRISPRPTRPAGIRSSACTAAARPRR